MPTTVTLVAVIFGSYVNNSTDDMAKLICPTFEVIRQSTLRGKCEFWCNVIIIFAKMKY